MKTWKKVVISIAALIAFILAFVLGYVVYVLSSYSRLGDMDLDIVSSASYEEVNIDEEYSISTYNIGFGAYSQDFTFFLDTGYDEEGNATCGYYSKAKDEQSVMFNINGAATTISELDVDFALFQEVDTNSTRSYKINQNEVLKSTFREYDNVFAVNFHSAYLPYPLYDMHGKVNAGISTYSKYKIQSAYRYEYTVSDSLSKLFDLDRCFSDTTIKVANGKTLHIVNSHMSAYDKGGVIRAKQLEELNAFLKECKDNGDYVIVGGDFNHDLITFNPMYDYNTTTNRPFAETKKAPDWISYFFNEEGQTEFESGYTIIGSDNVPTCRNNDIEWEEGKTFTCVVDGFIVSDNIQVVSHQNIRTKNGNKNVDGFAYSDHEPAYMTFKLI